MVISYDILSSRRFKHHLGWTTLYEFEDVLLETLDATLIAPPSLPAPSITKRVTRSLLGTRKASAIQKRERVLIVVGMHQRELEWKLTLIEDSLHEWDILLGVLFDASAPSDRLSIPLASHLLNPAYLMDRLHHLFIPLSATLPNFERRGASATTLLPLACDVLQFGRCWESRPIAINAYGRQPAWFTNLLAGHFNHRESPDSVLYTSHTQASAFNDYQAHRAQFWSLLSRSQLSLAFDTPTVPRPGNQFNHSFLAQRWFEAISVGCVIVGRRPTCPETNEVLHWDQSTLELPDTEDEWLPFTLDLLEQSDRLREIGRRNYLHALRENDWRHRIKTMLDCALLPIPPKLTEQLDQLNRRADEVQQGKVVTPV